MAFMRAFIMHDQGRGRTQAIATVASGLVFILAIMWMLQAPVPYAVQSPGPTIDTLGEYHEVPLISVDGAPTYPGQDGEIRITTVVAAGGPGYPVNVAQAIRGWASSASTVVPREVLYPPNISQEQLADNAQQQMTRSQHDATILALAELGIEVPVQLIVSGVDAHAAAHGKVEVDDELLALTTPAHGRVEITTYPDLSRTLAQTPPGTSITLHVLRGGEEVDVTFTTGDDTHGGSLLGIFLNPDFEMPFDVSIEVDRVGGPSAGTMFALGIIELLSPDPLVGDHVVAGTGTIALNGRIGAIGGIKQKMAGALRDGAQFFLAPGDNCPQVQGNIPDGLTVVRVDTLDDAVTAAQAIRAGDVGDLPACS